MSTSITTGMDIIAVPTRSPRFEPDAAIMRSPSRARMSQDNRSVTYTWQASEPAEGESVPAVELTVWWSAESKCFTAVARPVENENYHGMRITKIANLIGGPTLQVRSAFFPRFSRKNLDGFAESARVWLERMSAL